MIIRKAVEVITSMAFLMLVAGNFYQKNHTIKSSAVALLFIVRISQL